MDTIIYINKALKKLYGFSVEDALKPNYRVVWSNSLTERRKDESNNVVELPKYSYIRDRYILEGYNSANKLNPEIAMSDGYEPIFVFDKNGEYLTPYLWACEYLINSLKNFNPGKRTERLDYNADEIAKEKEIQAYFGILEDMGSNTLNTQFRYGEAIALPGKEFK